MTTLFSIVTVTYNAADTVKRTLESVDSQSCRLFEHLIIDGCSTDGTIDIVNSFPSEKVHLLSESDNGIYDAMNKGISHSKGDYIIFLNAGDKFHSPDTLQKFADAILDNDYPGIVYGQTDIVDDKGQRLGPRHLTAPEVLTLQSFSRGMVVCHQAMAVLRKVMLPYNLKYRYSADYEWCIKCLQHSRNNIYLPTVVVDYLDQGMTTRNHRASLVERFKIMCRYYGVIPTICRHAGFALRYLKRRKNAPNIQ